MKNKKRSAIKKIELSKFWLMVFLVGFALMIFYFYKQKTEFASVRLSTEIKSVSLQETFPLMLTIDSSYEIEKVDLLITYDPKLVDLEEVSDFSPTRKKPNLQKKRGSFRLQAQNLGKKTALTMLFITKKIAGKTDIIIDKEKSSLIANSRNITPKNLPTVSMIIEK